MLYALLHQWCFLQDLPVKEGVISRAEIRGRILSIPVKSPSKTQFYFQLQELNGQTSKTQVLLSWYKQAPDLLVDQTWQFEVKLKKGRNLGNPGGFDYVNWLKARHVQWTGYIKPKTATLLEQPQLSSIKSLRQHLGGRLDQLAPSEEVSGILQALTLGLTGSISHGDWDLFRQTGTTHLMVISGAHIGLVFGLVFFLTKQLWRRQAFCCLRLPANRAASLVALLAAFAYAVMAGFAVPTQRALIACLFFSLHCWGRKKYSAWQGWRYALLVVLIIEPHAVLMPGFYLSFIAVAVMMMAGQRWRYKGLKQMLLIQAACLLGLLPLCLYWFSYGSISGFIANLLAIPLVGFCIVPLALLTLMLISFSWSSWLMLPLSLLVQLLLKWLHAVALLSSMNLTMGLSQIILPLMMMLSFLLLVIFPFRMMFWPALLLMVSAFFPSYEVIKPGQAKLFVLDVGQGLAVVVQTHQHVLIYDTGDKFYQGSDMAKLAILPFLQSRGIRAVDRVIISHPDKDHRGGLASLEAGVKVKELLVDDARFYRRGKSCHRVKPWVWEGISFRFLPIKKRLKRKNNHSCILQIQGLDQSILLTGDIEKEAEYYLMAHYPEQIPSEVLLIPHHGSKTSSSKAFLEAVKPKLALASMGFDNRFHFPHKEVMARYSELGIPVLSTKDDGMLTIEIK